MKGAFDWHGEISSGGHLISPDWIAKVQRDAFDAGATAMRDRIADGLRLWWSAAKEVAGRHWPGHPHAVVAKIEKIDVTTTEGRPDTQRRSTLPRLCAHSCCGSARVSCSWPACRLS